MLAALFSPILFCLLFFFLIASIAQRNFNIPFVPFKSICTIQTEVNSACYIRSVRLCDGKCCELLLFFNVLSFGTPLYSLSSL